MTLRWIPTLLFCLPISFGCLGCAGIDQIEESSLRKERNQLIMQKTALQSELRTGAPGVLTRDSVRTAEEMGRIDQRLIAIDRRLQRSPRRWFFQPKDTSRQPTTPPTHSHPIQATPVVSPVPTSRGPGVFDLYHD